MHRYGTETWIMFPLSNQWLFHLDVTCQHPNRIPNGFYTDHKNRASFAVGSSLVVFCNDGFKFSNPPPSGEKFHIIKCQSDGMWSGVSVGFECISEQSENYYST